MFEAWLDGGFRGVFLKLSRVLAGERLALASLGCTHGGGMSTRGEGEGGSRSPVDPGSIGARKRIL
jgi:hypothetical protein